MRGDLRIRGVARIECKSTRAGSFRVTDSMLDKIEEAAASGGTELPIIEIEMLSADGRVRRRIAVTPMWALEVLIDAAAKPS